jgi:lipid A ethanolaminephosphotransferase
MSFSRTEPAPAHRAAFPEASAPHFSSADALWKRLDQWLARPRSAAQVVLWLGLYLVLTTNWPLWNELARIGGAPSTYLPTVIAMSLLTLCGTVAMLSLTAWSRWLKPLWFAVVVLAAVVQHYMLEYRVVMDPTMIANAMQTDPNEARDLLSWRMAFNVLLVICPRGWALARARLRRCAFCPSSGAMRPCAAGRGGGAGHGACGDEPASWRR